MKELAQQFEGKGEVKGYTFTQKQTNDSAYLYEVRCNHTGNIHYEVFKKRINERFGTVVYPSAKTFGLYAWTFRDYNKALERFQEISR